MAETISDTSPIQYLFQCGLLELLPALYGTVVIPPAVVSEIQEGLICGVRLPAPKSLGWFRVRAPKQTRVLPLAGDLGPGEREVLSLAVETPGALAILDDSAARRWAANAGVRVIGTLGILVRAKKGGLLPAVRPVLDELDRLQFRLDPATREVVLRMAREPG